MKKFLVFCVISIVTICLGLMTFKFLTLEETLTVNQTVFEINIGDEVPLEIYRENPKSSTVITYESSRPDIVYYDYTSGKYIAEAKGGQATLTITSSISTIAPIVISVTVGDGSENSPYFIRTAYDLVKVGVSEIVNGDSVVKFPLNAYYKVVSDMDLSVVNDGEWTPIGSSENAFTGVMNFDNHIISGLKVTTATSYAGLFAKIGANENGINNISSVTIVNANLNGEFDYVGTLAGQNDGKIERVYIKDSVVTSTKANSKVGGLIGYQDGQAERIACLNSQITGSAMDNEVGGLIGKMEGINSNSCYLDRSYCEGVDVKGSGNVGGIVGNLKGAVLVNSYSKSVQKDSTIKGTVSAVTVSTTANLGGLVGKMEYISDANQSTVVDCYSTAKVTGSIVQSKGQLVGYIKDTSSITNRLYGLYYESTINAGMFGVGKSLTFGTISSLESESEKYMFIYSDLNDQNTNEKVFYSHESKTIEGVTKKFNWEIGEVWTLVLNDYPTLNMEGAYFDFSYIIENIADPFTISSLSELISLRDKVNSGEADYSKPYILKSNIDLSSIPDWEGIGNETYPFKGTFTCELDNNGNPKYSIKNLTCGISTNNNNYASSSNDYETNSQYKGLFGYIAGNGKVMNIVVHNPNINNGQNVGAIAGRCDGVMSNCKVTADSQSAKITTANIGFKNGSEIDNKVFVGGIVGLGNGTISNCKIEGVMVGFNGNSSSSSAFVGGIAGLNKKTLTNCSYVAKAGLSNVIKSNHLCFAFIGGVAGENQGRIDKCYVSSTNNNGIKTVVNITGSVSYADTFIGGISAVNSSTILQSFVDATIEGRKAGGIVSLNQGEISECYATGSVTGHTIGGFAYIIYNGRISNCYSLCSLNGVEKDSQKCGFSYSITEVSETERLASMEHCFAAVSFGGSGKCYYESVDQVRRDPYTLMYIYHYDRVAGYMIDCIYDYSTAGEAETSNKKFWAWDKFPWRTPEKIISDYNSDRNYYSYQYDCGMTTEEIMSAEGQNVFMTYGYDFSIWEFGNGYPKLKNVVKAN